MYLNRSIWLIVFVLIASSACAQTWNELYATAKGAYEKQDYATALTNANQSLLLFLNQDEKKKENHAAILRLLQLIHYDNSEFDKGLEFALKESSLSEETKDVHYAESIAQVGMFHQALENYDEAVKAFTESLETYKHFFQATESIVLETQLSIGINLFLQDKTREAYPLLNNVLTTPGLQPSALVAQGSYFLGQLQQQANDQKNAIQNFSKVELYYAAEGLTESEDYASLLTSLATSYELNGDIAKAEEVFAKAQGVYEAVDARQADYYQLIHLRAENLRRLGNTVKAEELYSAIPVQTLKGETAAVVMANRAAQAHAAGNFVQAEKFYRDALSNLDKNNGDHARKFSEYILNLAIALSEQNKHEEAIRTLDDVVPGAVSEYTLAIRKGNVLLNAGDKSQSLHFYKKAVEQLTASGKTFSPDWIMAMNGVGSVYTLGGRINSADSVFSKIVSSYKEGKSMRDGNFPVVLVNYSSVRQMQGQFQASYDLLFEGAGFLKKQAGANSIAYATILENLAHLNINRGVLSIAKSQIDSAVFLFEKLLGPKSSAFGSALITLARYHQHAGDFPSAEPSFKKAYFLFQELKAATPSEKVRATNGLAIFYQTMGNYEAAEPLFKESVALLERSGETTTAEYSTTLQNLATLYQFQGKFSEATALLEKTLALDQKVFGDNHPQYAIALKNLGVLYQKQGKLNNAQMLLERALQVTENVHGKNHPSYAVTISNLAALYQDQGKYKEAERAWQQSVALRKNLLGEEHPDYARSLYGLANIQFAQGNLDQAGDFFNIVTKQYLKQIRENFPSMSEKEKGAFYLKIKPVFEGYQDFCIQYFRKSAPSPKSAEILSQLYNVQLATKAILLNSSAKVRQQILASNDAAVVASYKQWLELKETIGRYYTLTAEERKGHEKISILQERANDLEKGLSKSSSAFRNQFAQQELDATAIRNALKPGEAAVEIIRIRRKFKEDSVYYVGLFLKPELTSPGLIIWPDGARLENRFYKYYRNTIKFHLDDTLSYNRFWRPLAKELQGINHLYISSDGIFNKVNLTSLQNPKDQRWVIDDFKISLVSNTKEIAEHTTEDHSITNDVHLYGYIDFNLNMDQTQHHATHPNLLTRNFGFSGDIPVLPGTNKEVDEIYTILKTANWNVAVHKMGEATEESVKKIHNPKILHVATHGFFMNDIDLLENDDDETGKFLKNPLLRSGLLLAGAGVKEDDKDATVVEDGILTAYEAMNLTLDNTDLIVMSACETGLGEIRNGEGVYGLQRSFLVAGASAVMMSLWQVDDTATQELMVKFYSNWMSGDHKMDAFRKAQLAMKEKYKSPFYWGAFIMVGY
jgi:CHAT domain-containing protein/tetratricopeptide (TPR) repeat protein